jgi:predicted tellurium resistance membrane protein TerC
MVFSVDSILAAVALTREFWVIATAIVVSVIAMLFSMDALSRFMERNPTVVMLALAFLVMIGMVLVAEGLGFHVPKGFVYTAMAFAAGVEGLNLLAKRAIRRRRRASQPAAASTPSPGRPRTARP